jgi:hypothetical protein
MVDTFLIEAFFCSDTCSTYPLILHNSWVIFFITIVSIDTNDR